MQFSDESIKEFQDIFEKEYSKKMTHEEAADSAYNLINFFNLLIKLDIKQRRKDKKLK